ncbi:hypothetical protein EVI01_12070 [Enterococcus villorum]|uniref:Uncharacterized protein n=1 Tax=Enterococcus villorum TaxID=112904 RepID=A0A511J1H7_9ENTE|nr:hypothetical protein EVI01_12070 [Enterococcus villorum]
MNEFAERIKSSYTMRNKSVETTKFGLKFWLVSAFFLANSRTGMAKTYECLRDIREQKAYLNS